MLVIVQKIVAKVRQISGIKFCYWTGIFWCQQDKTGQKLNIGNKTAMKLIAKRSPRPRREFRYPQPRDKNDILRQILSRYIHLYIILMPEADQKVFGGDTMLCKPILVFNTNFPNHFLIPHIHVEDLRILK